MWLLSVILVLYSIGCCDCWSWPARRSGNKASVSQLKEYLQSSAKDSTPLASIAANVITLPSPPVMEKTLQGTGRYARVTLVCLPGFLSVLDTYNNECTSNLCVTRFCGSAFTLSLTHTLITHQSHIPPLQPLPAHLLTAFYSLLTAFYYLLTAFYQPLTALITHQSHIPPLQPRSTHFLPLSTHFLPLSAHPLTAFFSLLTAF
jgi:hypothetical protein